MHEGSGVYLGEGRTAVIRRHGLIRGLEIIRTAEGFDQSAPPKEVWRAVILRSKVRLEEDRRSAETLMRTMAVFVKGGNLMDVMKHLYPQSEIKDIQARMRESEEELSAMRRLDMFRRVMKRFDNADRRRDQDQDNR